MKFTPQQNLPCLDGTDMSAVALYMQCFAEQVESSLVSVTDEYNSFMRAPVAIWTIPNQTGLVTGQFISFTSATVTSLNWPTTPLGNTPALPNLRGWYYIGCNGNLTDPTPAAGQSRSLVLQAIQNTGIISGDGILGQFQDTTLESLTGNGENVLPAGTVFFPGGDFTSPNPVDLSIQFFGTGVANNPNLTLTPQARLWVVYLGDTPQIGVV